MITVMARQITVIKKAGRKNNIPQVYITVIFPFNHCNLVLSKVR
jgi:hypothetical protein